MSAIFVSYSSKDRERVSELVDALKNQGFDVWWDKDLPLGGDWDERIQTALEESKTVFVVWSKNAMKSREVRAEANFADQENKLLPVRVDEVNVWARYRMIQYKDLRERPPEHDPNWNDVIAQLRARVYESGGDEADAETPIPDQASAPASSARFVFPASVILPSVMIGAGMLLIVAWILQADPDRLESQILFYTGLGILTVGALRSVFPFIGPSRKV